MEELFSQQRMEKCTGVFQKVINYSVAAKIFLCRVVTDEELEGKDLDQLSKMYFDVGVGDDLTSLPFLDMLIVFKMLSDHFSHRVERTGTSEKFTERFVVKTEFSEDEAFNLLEDIHRKIGIEIKPTNAGN